MKKERYSRPMVLAHQPVAFETRHCWNPGKGNSPGSDGNGGIHFPHGSNPNPTPCGAGTPGKGHLGSGKCNPKVN